MLKEDPGAEEMVQHFLALVLHRPHLKLILNSPYVPQILQEMRTEQSLMVNSVFFQESLCLNEIYNSIIC